MAEHDDTHVDALEALHADDGAPLELYGRHPWAPNRKVLAALLAGATTFLAARFGVDLGQEEQAAVTTLAATLVGYLVPES